MAFSDTLTIAPKQWVRLTDTPASGVRVQNQGDAAVFLQAANDADQPATTNGALLLAKMFAISADQLLADLFPSLGAASSHLWAYNPAEFATELSVSHG
ncbi:hypothetical protein [Salipiger bermudensis]|uniref:hypothetical protein n=1 Tax=Salipiger bermudensis TaxID=344736 RepID=UPI001CD51407|nr:hypothetical protein [Salipiger bermudensis]MCA1286255.1 hypothetical protein [Salipiger bermudensis]